MGGSPPKFCGGCKSSAQVNVGRKFEPPSYLDMISLSDSAVGDSKYITPSRTSSQALIYVLDSRCELILY